MVSMIGDRQATEVDPAIVESEQLLRQAIAAVGGASALIDLRRGHETPDPFAIDSLRQTLGFLALQVEQIQLTLEPRSTLVEPTTALPVSSFEPHPHTGVDAGGNGKVEQLVDFHVVPEPTEAELSGSVVDAPPDTSHEDSSANTSDSSLPDTESSTDSDSFDIDGYDLGGFSDHERRVIRHLFEHPGQQFSSAQLKALIPAPSPEDCQRAFRKLINSLEQHPLGTHLHHVGETRGRKYWLDVIEPSVGSEPDEVDEFMAAGANTSTVFQDETVTESQTVQLTEWGLCIDSQGELSLNDQSLRLRDMTKDTLKILLAHKGTMRFEEIHDALQARCPDNEITSDVLKGILHELDNFFEGLENSPWYDKQVRTADGIDRIITIKGKLEGDFADFLVQA